MGPAVNRAGRAAVQDRATDPEADRAVVLDWATDPEVDRAVVLDWATDPEADRAVVLDRATDPEVDQVGRVVVRDQGTALMVAAQASVAGMVEWGLAYLGVVPQVGQVKGCLSKGFLVAWQMRP